MVEQDAEHIILRQLPESDPRVAAARIILYEAFAKVDDMGLRVTTAAGHMTLWVDESARPEPEYDDDIQFFGE